MKDYVPRKTPEHEFLHVEFLDILGTRHYSRKITETWGSFTENGLNPSEKFGFADIKDIIVSDSNGSGVVSKFVRAASKPDDLVRFLPEFKLESWGIPKNSIEEFQNDDLVRENTQMIRAYFKDI